MKSGEPLGDELKIKVTAPPVDAAANQALIELLAEKLDCPRGRVELIRGQTSRHKTDHASRICGRGNQREIECGKLRVGALAFDAPPGIPERHPPCMVL